MYSEATQLLLLQVDPSKRSVSKSLRAMLVTVCIACLCLKNEARNRHVKLRATTSQMHELMFLNRSVRSWALENSELCEAIWSVVRVDCLNSALSHNEIRSQSTSNFRTRFPPSVWDKEQVNRPVDGQAVLLMGIGNDYRMVVIYIHVLLTFGLWKIFRKCDWKLPKK